MTSLSTQKTLGSSQSKSLSLSIVYRNVDELKLDGRNPRKHTKKQIRKIAESVRVFGFNNPCLVDEQLCVISGHGRVAAAKLLRMSQVPTVSIAHLTDEQVRAFQVADNKIAEDATWDRKLLAVNFESLLNSPLDFNLENTGFDLGEIQLLIENQSSVPQKTETAPEGFLYPPPSEAVTREGDMWVLGNHRILCGNPWNQHDCSALMNGQYAAVGFARLEASDVSDAERLTTLFHHIRQRSLSNAIHFVIADGLLIPTVGASANRAGFTLADVCVSLKRMPGSGSLYQEHADFVVVLRNTHGDLSTRQRFQRSNVWRDPVAKSRNQKVSVGSHHLPLSVVADAITDSTAPGDIVLSTFLSATLLASEQTGRICHGFSRDPAQVDEALRCWQKLTGRNAVHEKDSVSFDQIGEARYGRR